MALTPGRVLVVEDDPDNRDALAEIFRLRGYDVTSAPDGASAIRRLAPSGAGGALLLILIILILTGRL